MESFKNSNRGSILLNSLKLFRDEQIACDFEIRVEKYVFPVHRNILMASSEYFRAMLSSNFKESGQGFVEIGEVSSSAVKKCLDYLYTGEIEVNFESVDDIMNLASRLQIEEISEFCCKFLKSHLFVNECIDIWHYGRKYRNQEIVNQSEEFVKANFMKVILTEGYSKLEKDDVLRLLELYSSNGSVGILWNAVKSWIYHDESNRKQYILDFLQFIMGDMEANPITEVKESNEVKVIKEVVFHSKTSIAVDFVLEEQLVYSDEDALKYIITDVLYQDPVSSSNYFTLENVFILKQLFEKHQSYPNYSKIRSLMMLFMQNHFIDISKSDQFKNLSWEDMQSLFKSEHIKKVDEKSKFEAILKWIGTNDDGENGKTQHFSDLFQNLILERAEFEYLQKTMKEEPLVKGSTSSKEMIADAMCAQLLNRNLILEERVQDLEKEKATSIEIHLRQIVELENSLKELRETNLETMGLNGRKDLELAEISQDLNKAEGTKLMLWRKIRQLNRRLKNRKQQNQWLSQSCPWETSSDESESEYKEYETDNQLF